MKFNFILFYKTIFLILNLSTTIPRNKRAMGSVDIIIWTNSTIPYYIDETFSSSSQKLIQKAIDSIQSVTCLQFTKYKPDIHANWLKIENGERCFSEIGMQNKGEQALVLSASCREYGIILHEIGHSIGLLHEMMRPDRNQYINYLIDNIQDEAKSGFEVDSNYYKYFNTPFDFQSIMLYSPYEFSKNGLPVWMKLNKSDKTPIFDIREKDLSFWDVKAINELYQCGKKCTKTKCPSSNYLDQNCVCQTPEVFAQRQCKDDPNEISLCNNASQTNLCYSKPMIGSVACRKTCGRCFRYGEFGNVSPPPYKCVDEDENKCRRHKEDGYCYFDTWTKVNCKKSCNKCSEHSDPSQIEFVCKDRHNADLCEDWARNDQCDINAGFMRSNCAMSCGTCSTNSSARNSTKPCRNYSKDRYCDAIARENKCYGTTLKVCLGSCGKCGSNYERNEPNITEEEVSMKHKEKTNKECKDLIGNCEYFASDGQCQIYKESMKLHCAKTCNFCHNDQCQDEDSNDVCDDVKNRGLCVMHAGFANRCKKTCQLCQVIETEFPGKCRDRESKHICTEIIRRNQCQSEGIQRCQLSCNLCHMSSMKPSTKIFLKSTTLAPCIDNDSEESCTALRDRGFCQSYLNRAVLCRKTCKLCEIATIIPTIRSQCTNVMEDENCISLASTGYCDENKEYMLENCAKACQFCKTEDKDTRLPCPDTENSELCRSWAERGYCKDYSSYMNTHCPNTCGNCTSNNAISTESISSVKVKEECKNTENDESCESWKDSYCSTSHIAEMCKKSCGLCS